jgi:diguanylate cyclase (GGDEF)-like protein
MTERLVVEIVLGFLTVLTTVAVTKRPAPSHRFGASREEAAAVLRDAHAIVSAARRSTGDVQTVLANVIRAAAPQIDGVLFYEQDDAALVCSAAFGERFTYYAGAAIPLDDPSSLPAGALAAGHRVTLDDGAQALHPGDAAAAAVPMIRDTGRACVLAVASRRRFEPGAIERAIALAELAAPVYGMALDREHDRRRAEYDGLTGLLTPGAFRRRLGGLVERARFEPSARLGLAFLDTDHFKRWNDGYGHGAGDALLRELARVLRAHCRPDDVAARNGGDEFCLIFVETDKAVAVDRAEALRRSVAAIHLGELRPPGSNATIRISASIGVAAFPTDASNAAELLERADAAMYHSKETGRDAVSFVGIDGGFVRLGA